MIDGLLVVKYLAHEVFDQGFTGTPQKFSVPQRLASLLRFREKRKERNFDKKIRYTVRKEVALRYDAYYHKAYMEYLSVLKP